MKIKVAQVHPIPCQYSDLMKFHLIRPIRDSIDYENALHIVERLISFDPLNVDQSDYLELLTEQIEKYENQKYPIPADKQDPIDCLIFLLDENRMNASDLGKLLGNRQLGSKILRRERQLSKTHIRILSKYFRVSADLLL